MTKKSLISSNAGALTALDSLVAETSALSSLFEEIDPKDAAADLCVAQTWTRLRLAVEDSGLRQKEIANKLNVRPSVVSRWLSGKQNIGIRHLAELAWAVGFEIDVDMISASGKRVTQLSTCARLEYFVRISVTPVSASILPPVPFHKTASRLNYTQASELIELVPVIPNNSSAAVKVHA